MGCVGSPLRHLRDRGRELITKSGDLTTPSFRPAAGKALDLDAADGAMIEIVASGVPAGLGAQGTFAGEDQINVGPLPATLAGMGKVNIVLTADGQAANTVNVTIK